MPLTASAAPAVRFLDSEYHLISPRYARFRCAGREYEGDLALDDELLIQLRALELRPDEYGHALFEALFPPGSLLRDGFREVLASAEREGSRLRFRLHLAGRIGIDLHALYWELLRDEDRDLALGRSPETAFSRYATVPRQPGEPVEGELRLLCVIAAPSNAADYNLAEIERGAAMERLAAALQVEPESLHVDFLDPPATPGRLRSKLVEGAYHVVHIFGHGLVMPQDRQARLVMESETGEASFVTEKVLAEIFLGDKNLRLVTLVACHGGAFSSEDSFSGLAGRLVSRGLPSVVAMRRAVTLDMAERFTDHLYRELVRTGRIDTAMNEARHQLYFRDPSGLAWSSPMLFTRLPNGRLWKRRQETPPPEVSLVSASLGAGNLGAGAGAPEPASPAALRRRGLLARRLGAGGRAALRVMVWLPAVVFAALLTTAFVPARTVAMEMEARASLVRFRLGERARALGPWSLDQLVVPQPGTIRASGSGSLPGALAELEAADTTEPPPGFLVRRPESGGAEDAALTLETDVLGKDVEVVLEHLGGAVYRAVLTGSDRPFLITLAGPLQLTVFGGGAAVLEAGENRVLEVEADGETLEVEATFAGFRGDEITNGVPLAGLGFDRIEESHTEAGTSVQSVSTLHGGTLRLASREAPYQLTDGEGLDLRLASGSLRQLRLGPDGMRLGVTATATRLGRSRAAGQPAESLLPSYLGVWLGDAARIPVLGVGGVLAVIVPLGAPFLFARLGGRREATDSKRGRRGRHARTGDETGSSARPSSPV